MATTIKVPLELRDHTSKGAREQGLSAASLIERLLDGHEWRQRMETFGSAIREVGAAYWDEFRAWDVTSSDA